MIGITAEEAAQTVLFAIFDGEVRKSSGKYISELRFREQYSLVKDKGLQELIWADTSDLLAPWLGD